MSFKGLVSNSLVFFLLICSFNAFAQGDHRSDRILVKAKAGQEKALLSLVKNSGGEVLKTYSQIKGLHLISVPSVSTAKAMCETIDLSEHVEYAELDHYLVEPQAVPNDIFYGQLRQWGLHNEGQQNGKIDTDIDAPEAWDIRTNAENVVVAVIDTGLNINHEDIRPNVWLNANEIAGNGTDDDGNGYVDDVHGVNMLGDSQDISDNIGHGTEMSGILGARGNNGIGVSGIAWNIQIMPIKIFDKDKATGRDISPSTSTIVDALSYAIDQDVDIINASFGSNETDRVSREMYLEVRNAGIILVTSAGNNARDIDQEGFYPASYNYDNIISVAAINHVNRLQASSSWGHNDVDIAAPGQDIYTTSNTAGEYTSVTGTSPAAPFVAGTLALLKAQFPNDDYRMLIERVKLTADKVVGLVGNTASGGRLNLHRALNEEETVTWKDLPPHGIDTDQDVINMPIHYIAKQARTVKVGLFDADWNFITGAERGVAAGSGRINLQIPVKGKVPANASDLQWKVDIRPHNSQWFEILAARFIYNVTSYSSNTNSQPQPFNNNTGPNAEIRLNSWEFDDQEGVTSVPGGQSGNSSWPGVVADYETFDWVKFSQVDLASGYDNFSLEYASTFNGQLEVRLDSPNGLKIGTVNYMSTGGWSSYGTSKAKLNRVKASGVHDIYFVMRTKVANVRAFKLTDTNSVSDSQDLNNDTDVEMLTLKAWEYDSSEGLGQTWKGGIGGFNSGDWVKFANVDFGQGGFNTVDISLASDLNHSFELRLGSLNGPLLGRVEGAANGNWDQKIIETSSVLNSNKLQGVQDIYLTSTKGAGNIEVISFY